MTREERKRTRSTALDLVIGALCVGILLGGLIPPFDGETFKTLMAFIGCCTCAVSVVRLVSWLDR